MPGIRERFAALITAQPTDLGRAALEIARIAQPDLDPEPSLRTLDALAAGLAPRLPSDPPPDDAARLLAHYLFDECGFRGNRDDYYDPRNSFLNQVLERRAGIPISLSVLAIEVARRLRSPREGGGARRQCSVGASQSSCLSFVRISAASSAPGATSR